MLRKLATAIRTIFFIRNIDRKKVTIRLKQEKNVTVFEPIDFVTKEFLRNGAACAQSILWETLPSPYQIDTLLWI